MWKLRIFFYRRVYAWLCFLAWGDSREMSKLYDIDYISKIDSIKFNFERDFVVNSRITFSDTDHWNDFGEIYFGRKLIENSKLKYLID